MRRERILAGSFCWSFICGLSLMLSSPLQAGDWGGFRGPQGNGVAEDGNYATSWSKTENLKWTTPLVGKGNSSPIVTGSSVFVTTANEDGTVRTLLSFDRNTGKENWKKAVQFPTVKETHKTNPYSGSTPASDGKKVVVWHGSAGLYCYEVATGDELWTQKLGEVGHIWGYGSSPVIYAGKVILNFGPGKETFVAAYDLETGKEVWKTEEPGGANSRNPRMVGSWSTPVVAKVNDQEQLICSMPTRVVAYDPETGKILWTVDGLPSKRGDLVYTSPVLTETFGIAMGGYQGPSIGFKLGGSGDVTETNRVWRMEEKQPQRIGSGVIIGKHLYMANAGPGILQCIDLETGEELWKARGSGNYWGSVVLAGGNLYATSVGGSTTVFKPNSEKFELVSENQLGGPSNSTPAFSDDQIFLRTQTALYCVEKKE